MSTSIGLLGCPAKGDALCIFHKSRQSMLGDSVLLQGLQTLLDILPLLVGTRQITHLGEMGLASFGHLLGLAGACFDETSITRIGTLIGPSSVDCCLVTRRDVAVANPSYTELPRCAGLHQGRQAAFALACAQGRQRACALKCASSTPRSPPSRTLGHVLQCARPLLCRALRHAHIETPYRTDVFFAPPPFRILS